MKRDEGPKRGTRASSHGRERGTGARSQGRERGTRARSEGREQGTRPRDRSAGWELGTGRDGGMGRRRDRSAGQAGETGPRDGTEGKEAQTTSTPYSCVMLEKSSISHAHSCLGIEFSDPRYIPRWKSRNSPRKKAR